VLLCRDISKLKQNAKLSAENKMLTLYSSTMSHELLTPLRCIKQVATAAAHNAPEVKSDLSLIVNSTDLLLNQVKGNLDKELLENDMFEPNLDESNLKEVVDNVLGILELQAENHGVSFVTKGFNDFDKNVLIDKLRV
jgi:signal transduction histidine kinase